MLLMEWKVGNQNYEHSSTFVCLGFCWEVSTLNLSSPFLIHWIMPIKITFILCRSSSTHVMSPLVKRLFLQFMPRVLMMRRTKYSLPDYDDTIHTNDVHEDMRWITRILFFPLNYLKRIFRDHYGNEYPHEYKDNHEGFDQNQHQQPGKFSGNHQIFYSASHILSPHYETEGEQIIIPRTLTSEVLAAIQSVRFIAQHIKDSDRDNEVSRLFHISWAW